jgi:hypothetical protein
MFADVLDFENLLIKISMYVPSDVITEYLISVLNDNTTSLSRCVNNRIKNERQWILGEERHMSGEPINKEYEAGQIAVRLYYMIYHLTHHSINSP